MKFHPIISALALVSVTQVHGAIVQYTDRPSFLAALTHAPVSTDFSTLVPGDLTSTSLTLFGDNAAATLLIETRDVANTFAGNNLWLSDTGDLNTALGASTTYSDQLRISKVGGFYTIGADWFLGDIEDNYLPGSVVLTFSDNSTYTVTSGSQAGSFRGFISDSPLASVLVSSSDPTNVAGWATIDNLVTIPEPSAFILGGIAALGTMARRRRAF
ncbi:PEP-CTERM sorting domain-containing protein [Luteolibacter yonseiensis]|uniref:PEP-CTERM sorting domain-containing protein n=1 Tax=Luteolibacter yonseiensis TaxID=1144680 RepID=A0A934R9X2_9BACT|nr:PEP-CTERM sorting domain-containing protein [Luteolibacter yonseiensis]MBK1817714.1 PEP-CTERM sorting domain-containing protein [Luteolibacter yonseiensis]